MKFRKKDIIVYNLLRFWGICQAGEDFFWCEMDPLKQERKVGEKKVNEIIKCTACTYGY
jgi:hypothetical protein